ncbi:hypothetical protein RDI58_027159 [Solanum bulbocastanum]|uniref:Uncharacterized protein n=1 Tax=Solanum bulbocastanum TaxID=147425 RepID=A0AAN8Y422_SOLBU
MRNNIQILKRTTEPIKVNINSGSEHIDIPEESGSVQNDDNMNTKERNARNNANALELRNTRNSAEKIACSENKIIVEGEVSVTKKGPDLVRESEKDLRHRKETEEDEDMEFNILQISKAGDLSPRHTKSLKNGAMKGRPLIPLQILLGKCGRGKRKTLDGLDEICCPKEEGGLGFRSLHDVNKALFAKLWWIFRVSTNSLWNQYMGNKYCKKMHPVVVTSNGASHVGPGALVYAEGEKALEEEPEVNEFINNGHWDEEKLAEVVSEETVHHIMENIKPIVSESNIDKAW